jgi:tape measure domain-containing protein
MTVGQVIAKLGLDQKEYEKGLRKAETQADKAGSKIGSIFKNAFSVTLGMGMFEALKKGFKSTVGTAISFNSMLQTAQIGFATMLGSAEKAQKFLEDMADFAIRTPFEYPELLEAAKRMLAYGFAAEEVLPTLRAVGDASAALGSGSVGIDRITLALGQIRAKGKLSGEEMRQLTEAGVPAWHILAEAMGTTVPELQKMVSKGLIPGGKAVEMLTAGMTKRFGGMMASMEDTWQGVTSSIKDIWRMTVGTLTQNLFGGLNAMLIKVRDFLSQFYSMLNAVMGKKAQQSTDALADSTKDQAEAMVDFGDATEDAAKKAKKNLQTFDEVHQLQEDMSDTALGDFNIPGAGISPLSEEPDTTLSEEPDLSWIDNLKAKFEDFKSTNFFEGISESAQLALQDTKTQLENFKITFGDIWGDIKLLAEPFAQWFNGDFTVMLQTGIETAGNILAGLLETVNMVFGDIWNIAIYPVVEKLATELLPMWTEIATEMIKTVDTLFTEVKGLFDMLWEQGVKPTMEQIMGIWLDFADLLVEKWNTYGAPIFEAIWRAFQATGDLIKLVWETVLKPVWDAFMETVDWLWTNHLKPLLDNFLDFVGELILCATKIYNEFIAPLVKWFVEKFGPPITNVIKTIIRVIGTIIGVVFDVVGGVIKVLKGIIQFITGIFTGDWEKAWEGIKNIFGGIWDSFVGIFKGAINLVIDGINVLIKGINKLSINVPEWAKHIPGVPDELAGKRIGFNIKEIPKLAAGTNYVPQDMFTYLHEGEAVVPKKYNPAAAGLTAETIEQAVYRAFINALRIMQTSAKQDDKELVLKIDNTVLARMQLPAIIREGQRQGLNLVVQPQGV